MRASLGKLTAWAAMAAGLSLLACSSDPGTGEDGGVDGGVRSCGGPGGFDDHTVVCLADRQQFESLSARGPGRSEVKFIVTDFLKAGERGIRYYESSFYQLHDEWYWFRLLNGQPVPGEDFVQPVMGRSFSTIAEVYAWARQEPRLPLDLVWAGPSGATERLYSPRFYSISLDNPSRSFALGTIFHLPAREAPEAKPERWGFELEYSDNVTSHAQLTVIFKMLEGSLPAEIAGSLYWLVRSPDQEKTAAKMERDLLPYHDRILRYRDVVVLGEVEVYSPGLTAGALMAVRADHPERLNDSTQDTILITDFAPDFLPPASGLLTAVPQTPLAHINVLAKNRGIPNAYRGGVFEDPQLENLIYAAGFGAKAILRAESAQKMDIVQISNDEFEDWRRLRVKRPVSVEQVDVGALPYTIDLASRSFAEVEQLRPQLGGKAAGFLALVSAGGVTGPDEPLAITIRSYAEHVAPLRPLIQAMLANGDFSSKAAIRFLLLEGAEDFAVRYTAPAETSARDAFLALHPPGDPLGDLARGTGLRGKIRSLPIAPAALDAITQAIRDQFPKYSPRQGLRFRSSSTVEDIEGFNGAGLYDSNSGWIDPASAPDPSDRTHGIEWALKKTWASYWSFEAFEERRLESIDHLSGNMGVVVHARFDDDKEKSNGVLFLTLLPPGMTDRAVLDVNVQLGAESVTNPVGTSLPEADRVLLSAAPGATPRVERVRGSTRVAQGTWILSDVQLGSIFEQAERVGRHWLDSTNTLLPESQRSRSIVLDFEFREVNEGWPELVAGEPVHPSRIVLKQARSIDPGLRTVTSTGTRALPIPRDILSHAQRVDVRRCSSEAIELALTEATTDALVAPDLGHAKAPFTAVLRVDVKRSIPELGLSPRPETDPIEILHTDLASATHPGMESGGPWNVAIEVRPAAAQLQGISGLTVGADGTLRVRRDAATFETRLSAECRVELLHVTARAYLLTLLEQKLR